MAKRQLSEAGGSKLGQLAGAGTAIAEKADRSAIKRKAAGSRRNPGRSVRLISCAGC